MMLLRRVRSIDSLFAPARARAPAARTGERKRERTSEFNLLIYQRRTHTNASRLKGISARARTFIGRERDIRANLGAETPLGAPRARASDSYFLINNFNDAPRQFRYKAGTYMQIPVSVGRLRIVIYYVRRSSRTGPRAHAGVPADHFSYQRSSAPGDTTPCILHARGL